MLNFQKDELAVADNDLSTMIHEMIHARDAETHRLKYGEITANNLKDYFDLLDKKSKRKLDKLEQTGYNLDEISEYASYFYSKTKFNETYTEYLVKKYLEGV